MAQSFVQTLLFSLAVHKLIITTNSSSNMGSLHQTKTSGKMSGDGDSRRLNVRCTCHVPKLNFYYRSCDLSQSGPNPTPFLLQGPNPDRPQCAQAQYCWGGGGEDKGFEFAFHATSQLSLKLCIDGTLTRSLGGFEKNVCGCT